MKLTINKIFQQAIDAHKEGKLQEAENHYQTILRKEPTHPDANHNLGILKSSLGQLKQALPLFKIATEVNPNIDQFWVSYIRALVQENKLEEAEVISNKAIILKPNLVEAHYSLANILAKKDKLKEAEVSYKKAIELKPDFAEANNNLGITLVNLGRFNEAEASYKKAIELKPDFAEASNNLGTLLQDLNFSRLDDAEIYLRKAIKLNPNYMDAHDNLGIMLQKIRKFEEAEISHKKAIEIDPNFAKAYYNLGVLYFNLGKLDEAHTNYNKAIELKFDYTEAIIGRGQTLFNKKNFELALRDFKICNTEEARIFVLESLFALGRIDEIYERIEKYSTLDDLNLSISAFSNFIAAKEKKDTSHNFCKNPMNFRYFSNLAAHFENSTSFINGVIEELQEMEAIWEPYSKTTKNGFQSLSNLFQNPSGQLSNLKSIINNEIKLYRIKFKSDTCSLIRKWPSKSNLFAWHVILKQQGHQNLHMHKTGWVSGVVYLKVVPSLKESEGAIEFSLNGDRYSDFNSPKLIYQPKLGDIILFPSSLHHRTIPFTTDTDRLVIAFDLVPY